MKRPLQALLISPDDGDRAAIVAGRTTATVRVGLREYTHGPVMLCCHLKPWAVQADITQVTFIALGNLDQEEIEAAGYDSREHMLAGLRRFYPEVQLDSPVTFLRWENVRGWCVDYARARQEARDHGRCDCNTCMAGLFPKDEFHGSPTDLISGLPRD